MRQLLWPQTSLTSSPWTLTGLISNGQSLSVGLQSLVATDAAQPYNNVQLWDTSGTYNIGDPTTGTLTTQPLVTPPQSNATANRFSANIQVHDVRMANQITAFAKSAGYQDYKVASSNTGLSGQALSVINKGGTGDSYARGMYEAAALNRLVKATPRSTFGYGATVLVHGEADYLNAAYGTGIATLAANYQTDLKAITGQTRAIPMLIVQQYASPSSGGGVSLATQEQWQASITSSPGGILLVGGTYNCQRNSGLIHLTSLGYEQYGEYLAKGYMAVERWQKGTGTWAQCQPLQPISHSRTGSQVVLTFNVPVGPMVFDTSVTNPHQSGTYAAWAAGQGFEAWTGGPGGTIVGVSSVSISGNTVTINCASTPDTVSYAFTATETSNFPSAFMCGRLRDSDPTVGLSGTNLYNWCVSFTQAV